MRLNAKQRVFVKEYLIDLNSSQAAIRAGYSKKNADQLGSQLLRKTSVRAAVDEALEKRAKTSAITAEYVLSTIRETIERCRQATPVLQYNKSTKQMEKKDGEWKFEHSGVLKGCELLGRHLNLFKDSVEVSTKDGQPLVVLTMPRNGREATPEENQTQIKNENESSGS